MSSPRRSASERRQAQEDATSGRCPAGKTLRAGYVRRAYTRSNPWTGGSVSVGETVVRPTCVSANNAFRSLVRELAAANAGRGYPAPVLAQIASAFYAEGRAAGPVDNPEQYFTPEFAQRYATYQAECWSWSQTQTCSPCWC